MMTTTDLTAIGDTLSATYHRWLAGEVSQADLLSAAAAYTDALRERYGEF